MFFTSFHNSLLFCLKYKTLRSVIIEQLLYFFLFNCINLSLHVFKIASKILIKVVIPPHKKIYNKMKRISYEYTRISFLGLRKPKQGYCIRVTPQHLDSQAVVYSHM